jgi:Flp pilus assembly protein TadG
VIDMIDTHLIEEKAPTHEEGATLVFVAVVLVALLALTAFAVDFGRMWEERRQLQNGADAAALAIAEDCVRDLCDGLYDEYAVADLYADDNARDGFAEAWMVELDLDAQTVTVHNRTEDPGGDNHFDMLFAGVVGFDGFTVGAQATVAWGGLASEVATIPIIISDCEFTRPHGYGGAGGVFDEAGNLLSTPHLFDEPGPSHLPHQAPFPLWWSNGPSPTLEYPDTFWDLNEDGTPDAYPQPTVLTFHDGGTTEDCNAQAGQDADGDGKLPGGFGWLDVGGAGPCEAVIVSGWVDGDPGASPSSGCDSEMLSALLFTDGVNIPYFNDVAGVQGTGASGEFEVAGYGGFYVVGYNFGGQFVDYRPPLTSDPCRPGGVRPRGWTTGNDDRCLVGYFIEKVETTGDIGDDDGRGITVIKFIS